MTKTFRIDRFESTGLGQVVLRLVGPLTVETSSYLNTVFCDESTNTLIVDLEQVPYVDSVGLGSLAGVYVSSQKAGKRVAFTGANRRVLQLFKISKLDSVFLSFPTLDKAVDALNNAGTA